MKKWPHWSTSQAQASTNLFSIIFIHVSRSLQNYLKIILENADLTSHMLPYTNLASHMPACTNLTSYMPPYTKLASHTPAFKNLIYYTPAYTNLASHMPPHTNIDCIQTWLQEFPKLLQHIPV